MKDVEETHVHACLTEVLGCGAGLRADENVKSRPQRLQAVQ